MLIDIRELCKKYNFNPIGVIHGGTHKTQITWAEWGDAFYIQEYIK